MPLLLFFVVVIIIIVVVVLIVACRCREVLHMPVGDPDVDMTLVPLRSLNWSYATLRHHLLAESDVEFWRRCRSVTSLVQSGNMIEVAFGYQICIVGTILNSVCHVQVDGP